MNRLRVGVILPDHRVPSWVRHMMEGIKESPHAEVTALAFADQTHETSRPATRSYDRHIKLDQHIFRPNPNPLEKSDIRQILHNTQILGENLYERVSRLKAMRLDILLNLSLENLQKSLLNVARFGVWSLRCNEVRVTVGSEIGWLEILNDIPIMRCDIEILRDEYPRLITASVMATHPSSISLNQTLFFWRASHVVPRLLRLLRTNGEQGFFMRTGTAAPAEKAILPSSRQALMLTQKQALQISENKIRGNNTIQNWALMAGKGSDEEPLDWNKLRLSIPPRSVSWADPFLIKKEEKNYLFFEEYVKKTGRGHISYTILDDDGEISKPTVALERPYHLSYPFIFEHRGEFYMIPETSQNRAIETYRCLRFPDEWVYHETIMPDILAANVTLFQHSLRWWMFVNIAHDGGSIEDELHLYYSDDPLSREWKPHPLNPVVSDVRSARPAGRIFRRDGLLIRPSRDSSRGYGYALNFNSIINLTIHDYEEELVEYIEPLKRDFLGVRTFNSSGDFVVMGVLLKN